MNSDQKRWYNQAVKDCIEIVTEYMEDYQPYLANELNKLYK